MRDHIAYLGYVLRHKRFVRQCCRITRAPFWRSIIHDWSKFTPVEWRPYVHSFYNRDGTKRDWKARTDEDKAAFNVAWNHHQKNNKHHWQYWVLINDSDDPKMRSLPIPETYIREMVADWTGAGMAITGRMEVGEWYSKNKEKMILHDETRHRVEELIHEVEEHFRVGRMLGFYECT